MKLALFGLATALGLLGCANNACEKLVDKLCALAKLGHKQFFCATTSSQLGLVPWKYRSPLNAKCDELVSATSKLAATEANDLRAVNGFLKELERSMYQVRKENLRTLREMAAKDPAIAAALESKGLTYEIEALRRAEAKASEKKATADQRAVKPPGWVHPNATNLEALDYLQAGSAATEEAMDDMGIKKMVVLPKKKSLLIGAGAE